MIEYLTYWFIENNHSLPYNTTMDNKLNNFLLKATGKIIFFFSHCMQGWEVIYSVPLSLNYFWRHQFVIWSKQNYKPNHGSWIYIKEAFIWEISHHDCLKTTEQILFPRLTSNVIELNPTIPVRLTRSIVSHS